MMVTPNIQIDLSQLRKLTGGDDAFLIEILELIGRQSPFVVAQMKASYQEGDYQALSAAAHKYKSSINFLGNPELTGLVRQIESEAGRPVHLDQLSQLLTDFQATCDKLLIRINDELSELKANEVG